MTVKTIKGVKEETWESFRKMAKKNNMKMGNFLDYLIQTNKNPCSNFWEDLISNAPKITIKEAERRENLINSVRKEVWFRT